MTSRSNRLDGNIQAHVIVRLHTLGGRSASVCITILYESANPPRCPNSYVCDALLQQLHLLLYLHKYKNKESDILHKLGAAPVKSNSTLMCLAKSLIVFAAPLKVVSCLRGHRAEESPTDV